MKKAVKTLKFERKDRDFNPAKEFYRIRNFVKHKRLRDAGLVDPLISKAQMRKLGEEALKEFTDNSPWEGGHDPWAQAPPKPSPPKTGGDDPW